VKNEVDLKVWWKERKLDWSYCERSTKTCVGMKNGGRKPSGRPRMEMIDGLKKGSYIFGFFISSSLCLPGLT
jgi:hypothetical protein